MTIFLGLIIITAAIFAIARRIEVRLTLISAGFALGILGGGTAAVASTFFRTLSDETFILPICSAMGFAYVLKLTECDKHLVALLTQPLRRVRTLLIPGTVVVGFLV